LFQLNGADVMSDILNALDRIPRLSGLSVAQSLTIASLVHCLLGIAAIIVAVRKGRDWRWWGPIGLLGGTLVLVIALRMEPSQQSAP
jgi:hypothetical protein